MTTLNSPIIVTVTVTTSAAKYALVAKDAVGGDSSLSYNVDGSAVTIDQSFNQVSIINNGTTVLTASIQPNASSPLVSGGDGCVDIPASGGAVTLSGGIRRIQLIRAIGSGSVILVLENV